MLEVKNVEIRYGDFVAVKNLNFTVNSGQIFGLLGTNGAGKTTTFRVIMGLIEPTVGEVLYQGRKISYDDVNEIGYMIEERSLLTKLTVRDLVLFFGQLKEMKKDLILEHLKYWLERFKITNYIDKRIKELSKGNQQKIQFITALINNPKILILDEPFSGLDPINSLLFKEVIVEFQKKGSIIIFSTHQVDDIETFCDYVLILERGEKLLAGLIKDIKTDFKKSDIKIIADELNFAAIKQIPGVISVEENAMEVIVKVTDQTVSAAVFENIKNAQNVTKYELVQASLSEIFIEKVGQSYE